MYTADVTKDYDNFTDYDNVTFTSCTNTEIKDFNNFFLNFHFYQ